MKKIKTSPSGGISSTSYYKMFPCLKVFFPLESGSVTTEAIDVISGIKLLSMPWTQNSRTGAYMNVPSETNLREHLIGTCGHHNAFLQSGRWPNTGSLTDASKRKSSIWLISGRFDGNFSFGFGDSEPTGREIVFSQNGSTAYATFTSSGTNLYIPSDALGAGSIPGVLSSSVFSFCGLIINEEEGQFEFFITDANGDYQYATRSISDFPSWVGQLFFPTYSIGRDVVTSLDTGIVDLGPIAVFTFQNGIPPDSRSALKAMRDNWANGIKTLPESWKGLPCAVEDYIMPEPGTTELTVDSSTQITINHSGSSHPNGVASYTILHALGAGLYATLASDVSFPYVHSGLTAGSYHAYTVRTISTTNEVILSTSKWAQTTP